MNIIYVSSTCSSEKYYEYVESKGVRISQQAQKYNLLLAEGLASSGARVRLISSRPINRRVAKRLWFKFEKENVNGVDFSYVPFLNYSLLRKVFIFFGVFFSILFSPFDHKKKETAVICDALNITATIAAQLASSIRRFQTVGIVTDVPGHLSYSSKVSFSQKVNLSVMQKFKSYLLLTEPMSDIVNPKKRPYIVLEGHADLNMAAVENSPEYKSSEKICLYAGSLMRIYGIETLVKGFVAANVPGCALHIYGNGDYVQELKQLCEETKTVKYLGVAPNHEIVKAEIEATLLINPRPTHEEYTKYSFPSKNMEYMASGTPVLTTKLPGMPADHLPYVYLIEDESVDGIAQVLRALLSGSTEELWKKGKDAKEFILKEKNNVSQARKVLEMIENIFNLGVKK